MDGEHFALFGLGNPGSRYEHTRHNAGSLFLDWFADERGISFSADKHQCLSASFRSGRNRITLLKPQTFMNRSGRAIAGFVNYYNLDPEHVLVVHDDIDMANGRMKLVFGSGAGGHNGIRSITAELGSSDFYRLKIGIGRPGCGDTSPHMEVDTYVLARFSEQQFEEIESRFNEITRGLSFFFAGDIARAQTHVNAIR